MGDHSRLRPFWRGFAQAFDLAGLLGPSRDDLDDWPSVQQALRQDALALRQDWVAVNNDFRKVMGDYGVIGDLDMIPDETVEGADKAGDDGE